jgi:hypothetical protein
MQGKGEKNLLIDSVEGSRGTFWHACLLASKYPDVALSALCNGIRNTTDPERRAMLVMVLGDIPGDGPVPFLLKEMNDGPFIDARIQAAQALFRRGRPEAVPAMIREWRKGPKHDAHFIPEYLLEFLAWCGKPEAVHALAENYADRPADVRIHIIAAFDNNIDLIIHSVGTPGSLKRPSSEKGVLSFSEPVRSEIEALLAAGLEDTDKQEYSNVEILFPGYPEDCRICEIAASILAQYWPGKYSFNLNGDLETRENQRLECLEELRGMKKQEFPASRPR